MKILAMAKLLVAAVVRGDENAQCFYAHELMLDALARGWRKYD
jgi:hypothetical protein